MIMQLAMVVPANHALKAANLIIEMDHVPAHMQIYRGTGHEAEGRPYL